MPDDPADLPEDVLRNRAAWDAWAPDWVAAGEQRWRSTEPIWGIWELPESECGMIPRDVAGMRAIELGCGTAYVSAWLAARGAQPVAVDNSEAQLATARRLQAVHGVAFPLHHGNAEQTPFADESFDLVISEYGASLWCDPYLWIPEAARLLRPGGRLHFLVSTPLLMLFAPDEPDTPAGTTLLRPYFGMHRFEWSDDPSVEYHIGHGEMIRLLRSAGFEIEALHELRVSPDTSARWPSVTPEWGSRWPTEEVWRAVKSGSPST